MSRFYRNKKELKLMEQRAKEIAELEQDAREHVRWMELESQKFPVFVRSTPEWKQFTLKLLIFKVYWSRCSDKILNMRADVESTFESLKERVERGS